MIILLDGSKGAGKTSVGKILAQKLGAMYLSLDVERRALNNEKQNSPEPNREAFENLLEKTKKFLSEGDLIIDCGLTQERVEKLDTLAVDTKIYKFLLRAHRDTELERVRHRDSAKNKKTDVGRFNEVHHIVHSKEFKDFKVIETDRLEPDEIANEIIKSSVMLR